MLKLINSSYRPLCFTTTHLCNELSLSVLHCVPRKGCSLMCKTNKSLAELYFANNISHNSGGRANFKQYSSRIVVVNDCIKPNIDINIKMSDNEQPHLHHVSCGGGFDILDAASSSDDVPNNKPAVGESGDAELQDQSRRPRAKSHFRSWETVKKPENPENGSFKFKVLSYNVLAQYLLEWHPYLYRDCSTQCLKWKFRSELLYEEIVNLGPDILCLQEVEAGHIPTFYSKLNQLGYCCIFKQKTGSRHDGCAIYYKDSMFEMQDSISVEFFQPDLPILNRDNIGVIVKLIPRCMPDSPFIVATTHLLFNPKRTDVRLAQMQVFLAEIDRFAFSLRKGSGHVPIILTGDLNSLPDSAVVGLLSTGNVLAGPYRDGEGCDWTKIGVTDNCQHLAVYLSRLKGDQKVVHQHKLMIYNSDYTSCPVSPGEPVTDDDVVLNNNLFNSENVGHSLKLTSVYGHTKRDGQQEATTFQNYWVTVDYIYFSCQSGLNLLERLYLPTTEECEVLKVLPNEDYGSDHLALGAVFELNPPKCSL